jgi:hypothetical protein
MQRSQTYSLKFESPQWQKRAICLPADKKAAASECSFEGMSQRANTETTVMRRILSFPLTGPKN